MTIYFRGGGDPAFGSPVSALPGAPTSGLTRYVAPYAGFPVWWTVDSDGRHRPDLTWHERGLAHYRVTPNAPTASIEPIGTSGAWLDGHNGIELLGFGVITHPAPSNTNLQTSARRYTASTLTIANQFGGIAAPNTGSSGFCFRSTTARCGKLFLSITWSWSGTIANTSFAFAGLLGALGSVNDAVVVGYRTGETAANQYILTATGAQGGTDTQRELDGTIANPLGGVFPASPRSITQVYKTSIIFEAGTGVVGLRHYGLSTRELFFDGLLTATLPTVGTLLRWTCEGGNGTTGAAAIMNFYGMEAWVGEDNE